MWPQTAFYKKTSLGSSLTEDLFMIPITWKMKFKLDSKAPAPLFGFIPFLSPTCYIEPFLIPLMAISNAFNIHSPPLYVSALPTPVTP